MTVKELMSRLKEANPDAVVTYLCVVKGEQIHRCASIVNIYEDSILLTSFLDV